ncbi:hypothetical protein [Kineococcus arenarius]|uniref:hypothetical protein n=1 Tax=unclassified Kineococcus TaxID=2621656 RepID=UPI003D7DA9D8
MDLDATLAVIDHAVPQKVPLGFRNTEANEYLRRLPEAAIYGMPPTLPDAGAWFRHGYGNTMETFAENLG